ncbi:MAG: hypothetical protein ACFUZC_02175 [Chthoniobacteraceae bacterium]
MIDSVKPVKIRRDRSGAIALSCPSRGPFFLGARERQALAKLIRGQRDAFWEAETGTPRSGEPFTLGDLAELEPLLGWLNQEG